MGRKRRNIYITEPAIAVNDGSCIDSWVPLDLLEEILLRLPVRSLLRCKAVCKSLYHLIKSEQFLASYHACWKNCYGEEYGLDKSFNWSGLYWHPRENKTLRAFVSLHGARNWRWVSAESGLKRSPGACRNRWRDYLDPGLVDPRPFSKEEAKKVVELHGLHCMKGHRWALIARELPGRRWPAVKEWWKKNKKPGRT
ncbi:hypothetical protein CRG98_015395 [Punica granatum]|uniref:F-box domain-containing protein n=1 Tax=Punica granatum TaxID=22663 RepID=A0A2I0K6N4_PUNGR|nr:hypothetical protein CRG98_015395 [Punica granatum]